MSITQIYPGGEGRAQAVARRVRGLMGEQRLAGRQIAQRLSMSQPAFSRRFTGELEFSLTEIERLAEVLGVSDAYLLGFTDDRSPSQEIPAGASSVRHQGLEPRTRCLVDSGRGLRLVVTTPSGYSMGTPAAELSRSRRILEIVPTIVVEPVAEPVAEQLLDDLADVLLFPLERVAGRAS